MNVHRQKFNLPHACDVANVIHLPRPMTFDQNAIDAGRFRALEQYQAARTDAERVRALIWVNHWRIRNEHAKALRRAGLLG